MFERFYGGTHFYLMITDRGGGGGDSPERSGAGFELRLLQRHLPPSISAAASASGDNCTQCRNQRCLNGPMGVLQPLPDFGETSGFVQNPRALNVGLR